MEKIIFEEVFPDSIDIIRSVAYQIFPETYLNLLSKKQIDYMMDMMYSVKALELNFKEGSRFYFLKIDNKVNGYGSISYENHISILHKIYISSAFRGIGLGKSFILFLENEAKILGSNKIQLYVKRDNPAKEFYENMGYIAIKEVDKAIGNGYFMNDFLMEKDLLS